MGESAAQTFTLVAGPFSRAEPLRRFLDAVATLPGVCGMAIRAFEEQRLSLLVEYHDPLPLADRLLQIVEFVAGVQQADDQCIRLTVHEPESSG